MKRPRHLRRLGAPPPDTFWPNVLSAAIGTFIGVGIVALIFNATGDRAAE